VTEVDDLWAKKEQQLRAARRLLARKAAAKGLMPFMRLMLPDEADPFDSEKSEYQITAHGRLLCDLVESLYRGERKRVAVSIPPQHGKTWHLSWYGPAWILGQNPKARIVVATYNETRAEELGAHLRKVLMSDEYRAIFPNTELETGSKSKSAMATTRGGHIFFVGTGGTVTGRSADYFIIDDPIKDDDEIQSDKFREDMWKWFFSVAYSRGNKKTRMMVIHTRWHADDLIGRLCDPTHPERNKRFQGIADEWLHLNISGVITDPALARALGLTLTIPIHPKVIQAFGIQPMVALWEEDKDLAHFAQWKLGEPRTFSALIMGQPTIEGGDYFKREWLVEYGVEDLPPKEKLRFYGASDHAVSEKAGRDYTVLGCVGIDENDDIWVLPDLVWERMETDRTVEELLVQFRTHRPELWWMEDEMISKSFGPFLHTRMRETKTYTTIDTVRPGKDKKTRARSIQGRMQMKKVHFPRFAGWWSDGRSQLLQFPNGAHDDFVDWLAHIGMGLTKEVRPAKPADTKVVDLKGYSIERLLRASKARLDNDQRAAANRGW
jgi:predicted phage terminase large subunit-like protein